MQSSFRIRLQHQRYACCRKAKEDAIKKKAAKKAANDVVKDNKKPEKLKVNDISDVKYVNNNPKYKRNPNPNPKSNLPYLAEYQRRKEEKLSSS